MVDETISEVKAGGSPVIDLVVGSSYLMADRPGVYSIVQFESAEDVLVREHGSCALHQVSTNLLRLMQSSENTRDRDLQLEESIRLKSAEIMLEAISPLLKYKRIPKRALEARAKEVDKAPKTLKKWLSRYKKDPRLSSLTRKRRKDAGDFRFEPLIERQIEVAVEALLADGNMTLKDAHGDLIDVVKALAKQQGWKKYKIPSYGTFYSRYLSVSEKDKVAARLGARPARLQHGLQKGSMMDMDHPLAVVQVDHLELPVVVVDEEHRVPIGKPWITVLIDLFSRCIVGYYITLESPGNLSLGLAISHAILSKDDTLKLLGFPAKWPISGFMWAIHADNAGEFHGNMLELVAKEYLIDLMFRKVREPNYGAYIESYLGTLSEQLRRVPGSTREGPEALGETDPTASAAMTMTEIDRYVLNLFLEYMNRPHSGLNGAIPLGRFAEGMRGGAGVIPVGRLRQATDPQKLKLDLLPCDERCVHTKGIVWDHIWYTDDCLQRWVNAVDPTNLHEKRKFLVRRDPRDLSRIYFWDPEKMCYRVIGTRNITRPSITLWEMNAIRKHLADRGIETIDEDIIFAAREERRRIREEAVVKTKAAKARRAREKERERRSREGAEAHQKTQPDSPPANGSSGLQADGVTKPSVSPTGKAYTMDWGDP
jgi:putative transposase